MTFDPETEGPQLKHALDTFQYQLKGVSFLPRLAKGAYAQMPYEEIDEATYKEMVCVCVCVCLCVAFHASKFATNEFSGQPVFSFLLHTCAPSSPRRMCMR